MVLPLTFPFRVRAEITDDMSLPGLAVIYGDGYKQRRRNGLVVPKTVWNIECILNNKTDEITLENFIRLVGNYTYFLWKSPRDPEPCFYYLTGRVGGSYRMGGGNKKDFFVRTMQFEDANIVIVPPTPTPTPTPVIKPVATITGATEAGGFTISITAAQPTNTIIYLNRFYTGYYTGFLNEAITVTVIAGSLSVNLPFGDRRTVAPFGNITVTIIVGLNNYTTANGYNVATINFP